MNCPYCGHELKDVDNFCTSCGTRVRRRQAAAPSAQPAQRTAARPRPAGLADAPNARRGTAGQGGLASARDLGRGVQPHDDAVAAARPARVETMAPDPQARRAAAGGGAAAPAPKPEPGWGSLGVALLAILASACALAAGLALLCAPLLEIPLLGGSAATSSELVHAVLVSVDPGLSVFLSGLLDVGGLSALDLVAAGAGLSDALGSTLLAVAFGLVLGLAAVAALMGVFGALTTVLLRKPNLLLTASGLLLCLFGAGGAVAAAVADDRLVGWLRDGFSAAFAELGVQLPAAAQVVAPTVWLVVVAVCGFAAFVLALVARGRWRACRLGV